MSPRQNAEAGRVVHVPQVTHPTKCYRQPGLDGPFAMEHCGKPKGHDGPHTWERENPYGTYDHEGRFTWTT